VLCIGSVAAGGSAAAAQEAPVEARPGTTPPLPLPVDLVARPQAAGDGPGGDEDAGMGRRLQESLRARGRDVFGCYDRAQASAGHELSGELLVRLWVAPGGAVPRVDILKDQVDSAVLTTCLQAAMRAWRVPELAGGETAQLVFPLVFRPDQPGFDAAPPVETEPAGAVLAHLSLGAGERVGEHGHPGVLEVLYVVHGSLRVRGRRQGDVVVADARDVVAVPPSGRHSLEGATPGAGRVEFLQLLAPAVGARAGERETDMPVVVRARDAAALEVLAGRGRAHLYLDNLPTAQASLQRIEIEPGSPTPFPSAGPSDELSYVLEGRGIMTVAGRSYPLGPGTALRLPRGERRSLLVSDRLVMVQCYAPAGPEQRYKRRPARP